MFIVLLSFNIPDGDVLHNEVWLLFTFRFTLHQRIRLMLVPVVRVLALVEYLRLGLSIFTAVKILRYHVLLLGVVEAGVGLDDRQSDQELGVDILLTD
jgi:hypothetical protein